MQDMRLQITDIGAISHTDMRLDGITVLVGENGTGKSTVCRTLFATIKALRTNLDDVQQTRKANVQNLLEEHLLRSDGYFDLSENNPNAEITDKLIRLPLEHVDKATVSSILEDLTVNDKAAARTQLVEQLVRRLTLADEAILRQLRFNVLQAEHVRSRGDDKESKGSIAVELADRPLIGLGIHGEVAPNPRSANPDWGISEDATMLDDPRLLDDMDFLNPFTMRRVNRNRHTDDLRGKILDSGQTDAITQLATQKSLSNVLQSLREHAGGELISTRYRLKFKENGVNRELDLQDVSDGRKTFIMLLQLLSNNMLNEDDVLILDEPEIHLHPAWQLDLAQMLVELRREFHLTILVSTHSPYFLEALETYTGKQGLTDDTHYYMMVRDENGSCKSVDITHRLEQAYRVLAEPFDRLETMENER